MGGVCSCFEGDQKREQDLLASQEARSKAAEAAQRRQKEFDQSPYGRAARAQAEKEKQSKNTIKSEPGGPGLKWQMG